MLRNNKGYFLLELLLSLSALLMLSLYLLPLLLDVREQSRQLEIEKTAQKLLYEELQAKLIDNRTFTDYTIILNKIEYKIFWKDPGLGEEKEVCVTVDKKSFRSQTNVCGLLE